MSRSKRLPYSHDRERWQNLQKRRRAARAAKTAEVPPNGGAIRVPWKRIAE